MPDHCADEMIRVEMGGRRWTFRADSAGARMAGRTLIDAADELVDDEGQPAAVRVEVPASLAELIDDLVGRRYAVRTSQG